MPPKINTCLISDNTHQLLTVKTLKPCDDAHGLSVVTSPTLTFSRLKQQKRQFSSKDQSDTSSGSQSG